MPIIATLGTMSSYLFTSRQNPLVCVVSDDPTGGSLPAQLGPWDRTETPWGGQDADLIAGIRKFLEALEAGPEDDEPPEPGLFNALD
jgi:hypothetical protein